jgi:hypothetical protein
MTERCLQSVKIALSGATQIPPGRASDPYLSILKTLASVEFYSSGSFFSILLDSSLYQLTS